LDVCGYDFIVFGILLLKFKINRYYRKVTMKINKITIVEHVRSSRILLRPVFLAVRRSRCLFDAKQRGRGGVDAIA